LLGIYFSRTDLRYYEGTYVVEDGFIEYLTVLALFMCGFLCFYRASILRPFKKPLFIFSLIFMGLVFVFGVGEEISWAQRIIGFETPEFFKKYNTQGEFNFHNLRFGGGASNPGEKGFRVNRIIFGTGLGIGVAIYFLILPVLYRKKENIKKLINKFALPLPRNYHIIAYLILFGLVQLIPTSKKGEILEFGGCWIFLLMMFEPLNREIFSRRLEKR
tara:strand:- start:221398 stop:222048 length:651 start_codon:yes stop_codon:yes gene_type:complete